MVFRRTAVAAAVAVMFVVGVIAGTAFAAKFRKDKSAKSDTSVKEAGKTAVAPENIIDTLDINVGWETFADNNCKVSLISAPGKFGKGLGVVYDLVSGITGSWAATSKAVSMDLSGAKALRFYCKGEGSKNSLECKVEDEAGSVFYFEVETKSNVGTWTTIEMPISEFVYCWGEKRELDWGKVKRIHLVVSKKSGDEGGAGKVVFDQIEMVK